MPVTTQPFSCTKLTGVHARSLTALDYMCLNFGLLEVPSVNVQRVNHCVFVTNDLEYDHGINSLEKVRSHFPLPLHQLSDDYTLYALDSN